MKYRLQYGYLIPLLLAFTALNAQAIPPTRGETVLNEVWDNVRKQHFSADFDQRYRLIYDKYLPEVKKSANDHQTALCLNRMLREFGHSHLQLLPPTGAVEQKILTAAAARDVILNSAAADVPADCGIIPIMANGKICVLRVVSDSAAALAGIKSGDEIIAVNGINLTPNYAGDIPWDMLTGIALAGLPDTVVKLQIMRSGETAPRNLQLIRKPNGFNWFKFGVLPRGFGAYYAELSPDGIAYLGLNAFFPEATAAFRKLVTGKFKPCRALIIDLRNNVGGVIVLPQWLAGWCYPQAIPMGKMKMKDTQLTLTSYPQSAGLKVPIAILINSGTASAAEIFAAAMQDAGAAKIFGETSSGKCLPSQFVLLPSGFRLQIVLGDYVRPCGEHIEHIGVKPDFPVTLSRQDLNLGIDTVRTAAAVYLNNIIKEKEMPR
jgi:carboxyl-terminal processing protease